MEYILIPIIALLASIMTFFSGFGLGTILLPAFAFFFPVELAVGMTAFVHFLNNLLKLILLGKHGNVKVVLSFGLPSVLAAFIGASLLIYLQEIPPVYEYDIFGKYCQLTLIKLVIGLLMVFFAVLELLPGFSKFSFPTKWLPIGGLLSGFFGGISGHQGALRSAFLVRLNLGKEQFIATGVIIACMIDITRLSIYSGSIIMSLWQSISLIFLAILFAFAGTFLGNKFLKKITISSIQKIVGSMLIIIGLTFRIRYNITRVEKNIVYYWVN